MKVLYILDVCEKYGASDSFIQMIKYLVSEFDIEPIILSSKKGRIYDWATQNNIVCYAVGHKAFLRDFGSTFFSKLYNIVFFPFLFLDYKISNFFAVKRVDKLINFDEISLIHTNVDRNDLGALLYKKYKIPHIWHVREFPPGYHFNLVSYRGNYLKFMNDYSTYFIAISESVKKEWCSNGLDKNKTSVIWDGIVENQNDNFLEKKSSSVKKIIMMGPISLEKGQIQLVKAVNMLPDDIKNQIRVDFCGDYGIYGLYLKKYIKHNKLDKIFNFKGYVNGLTNLLKEYDIGVICSKCEGLGRATVEYMSKGCLVIASDSGANTEIIKKGNNGFIYEYNNISDLKNILIDVINNFNTFSSMKKNAILFSYNFDCKEYSRKIFEVYKKIIQSEGFNS